MNKDIEKILVTPEQIAETVQQLGRQISEDYRGKNLMLVCILKGSIVFTADLMRAITIPCTVDFLSASSYGAGTQSSGDVKIIKDIAADLSGIDIIIVEDIIDTGYTLKCLLEKLSERNPASLKVCTLLDKPERRRALIEADYDGLKVPDEFIVGYGLDYNQQYRGLPYIGTLKREIYS